jgi:uncharacterized protein YxjI
MTHTRRYRIKAVPMSSNHLFLVTDDEDKTAYVFQNQSDKLVLIDSSGKVLINIRQISQIHPTFDIYTVDEHDHHNLLGVLRRIGPLWHHKFIIESIYGEYKIDRLGRLYKHEYMIMQDQESVAKIKHEEDDSEGFASIEISEGVDKNKDTFVLALVMIQYSL